MKIKGSSPLSSGAESLESLDPRDLRKAIESDRFAAALTQFEAQAGATDGASSANNTTRAALEQIANSSDLATGEGAASAVRESARYMIRSRLSDKYRDSEHAQRLVTDLSDYVANDPLLKNKLLSILHRVRTG
ncbi:MAG TPA: hypothetical protein VF666_10545 [Pyrinomonadaceae bacterium]|jgi:hypothetical protein